MTRHALLALGLAAGPAAAQGLAADYAAAVRAFTLPGVESLDPQTIMEDEPVLALLPSLQGVWVPTSVLFPTAGAFNPDLLREACQKVASTLVQIAPRSFEMRRMAMGAGAELPVRYDFVVGNTFQRSVPEQDLIDFLGLDGFDDLHPPMLAAVAIRGEVVMFNPSPDILVFVMPGSGPEIYARCP